MLLLFFLEYTGPLLSELLVILVAVVVIFGFLVGGECADSGSSSFSSSLLLLSDRGRFVDTCSELIVGDSWFGPIGNIAPPTTTDSFSMFKSHPSTTALLSDSPPLRVRLVIAAAGSCSVEGTTTLTFPVDVDGGSVRVASSLVV